MFWNALVMFVSPFGSLPVIGSIHKVVGASGQPVLRRPLGDQM